MKKELITISKQYELTDIIKKISELDRPIDLKIGFLGEFSSGKSTLINALLNQKVLPSMDKPTSKSVVEIIAKDNLDTTQFYKLYEDKKERISAIEFSEIALSYSDIKATIEVASNNFFQDGYMMVDTPGISSLDESDTDITYGYLPFLDCAVICNHIQKGSLTQSIINFLLKDEIRPIINNILFVITNAHSKSPRSQKKIKKEIVTQLTKLNQTYSLDMNNIESKVVLLSALEAMERKKGFSLNEIKNSFSKNFMSKKNLLKEQKRDKEIDIIINQLLEALIFKKDNSSLDLSELRAKEKQFDDKIAILEKEKTKIVKLLKRIDTNIQERIFTLFTKHLPQIKALQDEASITALLNELQEIMGRDISKIIALHFQELSILDEKSIEFSELEITIQDLLKQISMGKDIGMVVLIELLTLGTAGIGGLFGFFLRSTSKMILNQKGESNLKETANFINQVNPLEMIGDMVGSKLIESKIIPKLEELSKNISSDIRDELEVKIEKEVFTPLEEKLTQNQQMLNQLCAEKSEKLEIFTELNKSLDYDILELQLIKRG